MGQLWERVKRFARSQALPTSDNVYEVITEDEDGELRKAIDEALRSSKSSYDGSQSRSNSSQRSLKTEKDKAFEVFGLAQFVTNEEIKLRYKKLMKEFHPDAVASAPLSTQEHARKKAQEINVAYQYLRKLRKF